MRRYLPIWGCIVFFLAFGCGKKTTQSAAPPSVRPPPSPTAAVADTDADLPFVGVLSAEPLRIPLAPLKLTEPMKAGDHRGVSYIGVPDSDAGENAHPPKTGLAEFRFNNETGGEVWVWFRRWWDNSCADMFYFSVGDARHKTGEPLWIEFRATPENFRQWTWSRARRLTLAPGDLPFRITNGNDGWRVSEIILTRDPDFTP